MGKVVVEDLLNGVNMREGNKLLVLCDVLPVVDKQGLNMVGNGELDGGPVVEVILLVIVSA